MSWSFVRALDRVLPPLGFRRSGNDWVRIRGDMWECVNRQVSNHFEVTINLYIKDLKTEKLYLDIFASGGAVQMPPIDTRVGELIDGYDRWWRSDEPNGPSNMVADLVKYGLPWFDRVRTLEEQAELWCDRKGALTSRGYHGFSLIRLALTLYRMGEIGEACEVLRKPVPKTAIESSVRSVARLREWLGCDRG
jgi:hypothetical protein